MIICYVGFVLSAGAIFFGYVLSSVIVSNANSSPSGYAPVSQRLGGSGGGPRIVGIKDLPKDAPKGG